MKVMKFIEKGLILIMAASILMSAGCVPGGPVDPGTTDDPGTINDPGVHIKNDEGGIFTGKGKYDAALYVTKYADYDAMDKWIGENLGENKIPPVSFIVDGKKSSDLNWERSDGKAETVFDFEDDSPAERRYKVITYDAKDEGIRIELTLTGYPGYPIVEYSAVLKNTNNGNSGRISDLLCIDTVIEGYDGVRLIHANRGSTVSTTDFQALTYNAQKGVTLEVTNGKPTSAFMPCFNVENRTNNTGTIAVIDWQGNWKADIHQTDKGVTMTGGQYRTDFVLQNNEDVRVPGMVLLFYKGNYANGQSIYRRWLYNTQMFREQGKHMKSTNRLVCPSGFTEKSDLSYIQFYKESGLTEYLDKFNEDGGWAENGGAGWGFTGNWFANRAYPNELKPISDAAHKAGLEFAVWFEPERVAKGTKTTQDLTKPGQLICIGRNGKATTVDKVGTGANVLVNLGDPDSVKYVVDTISAYIKENGIDQYRQDFNMFPADYWNAYDESQTEELGIPRTGITENKYTGGYLAVFEGLLKNKPGLFIDACASGGMRYDLSTIRYSFMHTRSDNWMDDLSAQIQTYGSSMWTLYWGTGFNDLSSYNVRSHIGNSIGVGVALNDTKGAKLLIEALKEWEELSGYLFYDYYPLTKCSLSNPLAIQYDSPEEGRGMAVAYFRLAGTLQLKFQNLCPDAKYKILSIDDRENVMVKTGQELMDGITVTANSRAAFVYEYELAEGEDTTAFQKETVKTGPGSNDFVPVEDSSMTSMEAPVSDKKYHNGFTAAEMEAMYKITEDNKIEFAAYDYRNSGVYYAISKNIFDEVRKDKTEPIDGVWYAVTKQSFSITLNGSTYNFHTWDNTHFNVVPYMAQFGDSYYLWMSNMITFGDPDGGWKDSDVTFTWTKLGGGKGKSSTVKVYVDYTGCQKVNFYGMDEESSGHIYTITEEMFNSFKYTGKGFVKESVGWYEIDRNSIGVYSQPGVKLPYEGNNVEMLTEFLSALSNGCCAYAAKDDDTYYLWIKEFDDISVSSTSFSGARRAVLVWYDSETDQLCQQMFFADPS